MTDHPFEGALIRLRAREITDEPFIYRWLNDPEVTRHILVRYPFSHGEEEAYLRANSTPGYENLGLTIEDRADGHPIGTAALRRTSPENRSAGLAITIGEKSYWDGGYGTDTMRTLCRFGFETMNLHRIELDVFVTNARAIHVYEKIGFQREGLRREADFRFGAYRDIVMMSLLAGELR